MWVHTSTLKACLPFLLGALLSANSDIGVFLMRPPRVSMHTYCPAGPPLRGSTAAMRVSLVAVGRTCTNAGLPSCLFQTQAEHTSK